MLIINMFHCVPGVPLVKVERFAGGRLEKAPLSF